jgi:hypothetical protein
VLELPTSATRMEVERAGQKLLAQLAIGVTSVKRYKTPFGEAERDESHVRSALSALRDPEQRVIYELWAIDSPSEPESAALPAWPRALESIGWRGPCTD